MIEVLIDKKSRKSLPVSLSISQNAAMRPKLSRYESFEREGGIMEFAPGDTVQLKSGGPIMTVEQVGEYWSIEGSAVWCVWFEKVGNKQVASRETFAAVALDKAERPGFASFQVTRG